MSLGHQTLRYTKEDSYAVLLSLLLKTHPIVIVKKTVNPHPCSEQVLLCEAEKSGCLCAKSKGLLLHLWAAVTPWGSEGLLPSALPTALPSTASMLPGAEGAFVSDFLVSGSGKGSWWEQKRLTSDRERMERMWTCSCGLGRKGWRLRAHSAWAFTWWRNPYSAPGLFNIPNKILTAKGLCMVQLWVNSLGISVSL